MNSVDAVNRKINVYENILTQKKLKLNTIQMKCTMNLDKKRGNRYAEESYDYY